MKFISFQQKKIIQYELINKYNYKSKNKISCLFINCFLLIKLSNLNNNYLLSFFLSLELLLKKKIYYKLNQSKGKYNFLKIKIKCEDLFFFNYMWNNIPTNNYNKLNNYNNTLNSYIIKELKKNLILSSIDNCIQLYIIKPNIFTNNKEYIYMLKLFKFI